MATVCTRGQGYPTRQDALRPALADTRPERLMSAPPVPLRLPVRSRRMSAEHQRHPAAECPHQR